MSLTAYGPGQTGCPGEGSSGTWFAFARSWRTHPSMCSSMFSLPMTQPAAMHRKAGEEIGTATFQPSSP